MSEEDWLGRWEQGRIGWHEPLGNSGLRQNWSTVAAGSRVLVPLCGKTVDMLWLAEQGHDVSGVEISKAAIEAFLSEQQIRYECGRSGAVDVYRATERAITLYCGDFFAFHAEPFDALYDRGALVALPKDIRPQYVSHVNELVKPGAYRLIVTLEYDQARANGPPFSVEPDEIHRYWPDLERVSSRNDIDNCPPKFREAGLDEVIEAIWSSKARYQGASVPRHTLCNLLSV